MTTGYARSFKDLQVYQKACEVSRTVFRLSKAFPKEEMYSLTDQMRRAAHLICQRIHFFFGKGFGKPEHRPRHLARLLVNLQVFETSRIPCCHNSPQILVTVYRSEERRVGKE